MSGQSASLGIEAHTKDEIKKDEDKTDSEPEDEIGIRLSNLLAENRINQEGGETHKRTEGHTDNEVDITSAREPEDETGAQDYKIQIQDVEGENVEMDDEMRREFRIFSHPIFRVPTHIRASNPEAYEPKVMSFGPYHYGKEHLKPMENRKDSYKRDLFNRTGIDDTLLSLGMHLEKDRAKRCYAELTPMDDDEFVDMMTLDACVIVSVLLKASDYGGLADGDDVIFRDMMLLENQIPFFVLERVYRFVPNPRSTLVELFADLVTFAGWHGPLDTHLTIHHFIHLLDILMFRDQARDSLRLPRSYGAPRIPSATELEYLGVKFKPNKQIASFKNGTLHISPIKVDEIMEFYFRNMIAFEQGFEEASNAASSYAVLVNSLIRTPEDVVTLSSKDSGILRIYYKSNEQVLAFFRDISKGAGIYDKYQISNDIHRFCTSRRRKWIADFRHKYLLTPWQVVGLLAGILLLAFAGVQTLVTCLSYWHPKS